MQNCLIASSKTIVLSLFKMTDTLEPFMCHLISLIDALASLVKKSAYLCSCN